jgi:hypothetical protein
MFWFFEHWEACVVIGFVCWFLWAAAQNAKKQAEKLGGWIDWVSKLKR